MSAIGNIVMAAAMATTSLAFAGTSHLTDSQYLAAARCQGLYNSKALGVVDASGINRLVRSEGDYRSREVSDRADEAMQDAQHEVIHAGANGRQALIAERDGACQVWAHANAAQNTAAN